MQEEFALGGVICCCVSSPREGLKILVLFPVGLPGLSSYTPMSIDVGSNEEPDSQYR